MAEGAWFDVLQHHECDCTTGCCAKCSVIFKLDVVNKEAGVRVVTSLDLRPVDARVRGHASFGILPA